MTDTIFRGKRLDNGEWITGSLVTLNGKINHMNTYIMDDCASVGMNDSGYTLGYFKEVDPRTVGQATLVRDRTGRQVFEDDIVQDGNLVVVIKRQKTRVVPLNKYGRPVTWGLVDLGEIIGNRYDNPELLRGW